MSAKLIKSQASAVAVACAPFKLPELDAQPEAEVRPHAMPMPPPPPTMPATPNRRRTDVAPPANAQTTAEQADAVLQATRQEAEQLIAEAQARAIAIEREAQARGLAEAQANAAVDLNRAVEDLRAQLTQSLNQLSTLRAEMAERAERDTVRLAIEIAKKIVQREVTVDHEVALTLARVALARLHNRAVAKVRLHPDDYHYVIARREQAGADGSVEIIEDRQVGRGGCLVETEMGDIDARIEQQFAEIERNFLSG